MQARTIILSLVAALAMGVILVGEAQAGKPTPPPPPPPPPNPVIAFDGTFGKGKNAVTGVWKMNADGSNVTLVYRDFTRPSWSADGRQLVVNLGYELRRIDADGTNALVLATDSARPAQARWSPVTDPTSPAYNLIAYYDTDYSLVVIGAEGGRKTKLLQGTANPLYGGCGYNKPDWSRDGRVLVVQSLCGPTLVDSVIIVPLDNPAGHYVLLQDGAIQPRWARQRDALAFRRIVNDVHTTYTVELQVDGQGTYSVAGAPTLISTDSAVPAWSPDDSKVVLTWWGAPPGGLYTYEFATGQRTYLSSGDNPDWKR
jgi:Tol biopolymer transport system component